jgi:hypothetical protein
MKRELEDPLVKSGLLEKDFINSVALNVYHDGTEGLAQHFDDATRFKQVRFLKPNNFFIAYLHNQTFLRLSPFLWQLVLWFLQRGFYNSSTKGLHLHYGGR